MEHHSCDSKTRVGVLFWEEALYSDIWNIINKELKPIRDSEHSHIYLLEHLLDISEDLDSLKQKIVKNICNDVENGCSIFVLMGDIIVDALGACLVNDTSFDSLIRTKEVILIATIATCPEVIHPNLIRWWAPSANLIARYIAQYMLRIGIRQAACEEFYPINMQWSKDEGTPGGVFKTFFELGGGKINSESENVYVAGFGASYDEFYEKTMLRDSDKRFFTDHGIIGKLLKNDNARFSIPANVGYCDFIPKNSNERGETNYAIFVREIFSCIKRIRKWAKDISFLECLKSGRYLEFSLKDDCLLSDIGQILVPISFYRGDSKKIELLSDVGDISQEKIAYSLRIADQLAAELQINQLTSSPQNVWWEIGFRTFYRKALQNFGIYSCSTVVVHNNAKVERRFCSDTCQGTMHNVSEAVITLLLKNDGCIQLNIGIDDYEDNDAHRVYVVESGKIIPWGCVTQSPHKENIIRRISSIVIAKTRQSAELLYSHAKSQSKDSFIKSLNVEGASVIVGDTARTVVSELCSLPIDSKYYYLLIEHLGGYRSNSPLFGYVILTASNKLGYLALQAIRTIISRMLLGILSVESLRDMKVSQIKSAIGSIMSRNGSHNIGSHVLAALSHNVGTMPDDRMLYQYIQHRMDYIATSTTDMPTWTSAAKVTLGAIKTFLSQRHLLDYIAGSEGLHGYKFQDPNLIDEKIMEQRDAIRLHVIRRIDNQDIPLLPYRFGSVKKDCDGLANIEEARSNCNKFDVEAAFPGGIVGQHALFNILENIIRNAAKHGWAMMDKTRRGAFLDVYLRIEDDTSDSNMRITVFDGLSNIQEINGRNGGDIIEDTNRKLNEPFITKSGSLRRENWGLAEMRMSAGYLQRREIGEIGGIISLRKKPNVSDDFIIRAVNADNHIGYQFLLPKPREILIMVRSHDVQGIDVGRLQSLRACGIYVEVNDAREIATEKASNYDYKFVVLPQFEVKQKNPFLPFRVMVKCFSDRGKEVIDGPILIPALHEKYDELINELKSSATNATIAKNIKGIVCKRWIDYWCKDRRSLGYIPEIIVQPEDSGRATNGQKKSEQCLIKDVDVWKVVFGEVFHSLAGEGEAVTSKYGENAEEEAFYEFLLLIVSLPERKAMEFCNDEELSLRSSQKRWVIVHQLLDWYDKWADQLPNEDFCQEINARARDFILQYTSFRHCIVDNEGDNKGKRDLRIDFNDINTKTEIREFANRLRTWGADGMFEFDTDAGTEIAKYNGFVTFVSELEGAFLQTHVMIRKYEERIVTLPQSFAPRKKGSNDVVSKQGDLGLQCEDVGIKLVFVNSTTDHAHAGRSIDYRRHYGVDDFKLNIEHMLYAEPMSGTQGYLNAILSMREMENAGMFATGLIENALVRLLIVDERAADFLREHPTQTKVFSMMGIWVVDDKNMGESKSNDESLPKVTTLDEKLPLLDKHIILDRRVFKAVLKVLKGMKVGQNYSWKLERLRGLLRNHVKDWFDILIIHQGLIDKWFPGASSDKMQVELFIEFLKRVFPYVVITTGRGTPANIPASARILPFSIIENTLFKNSPEKMILIDTVMRVLPTGDHT